MGTKVTVANDRLDQICFAYYGSTDNEQVEDVLSANPGLEAQGILLPAGLTIALPDAPVVATSTPVIKQIKLWQ